LYITEDSFSLGGVNFNTDRIIASQLDGASHIAILVSTAGPLITWFSSELIKKGEFLRGYIADAFGSVVAERAADFAENEIKTLARSYGYNASNRLSPGYCGWDVSEQHKLFSFLPDKFCGVTLTESALMVPIKSTSAVIGIGENIKQGEYPCAECVRDDCFKRRKNAKDNR
jgi:cobalamin-dependent methionine synthase I